MRVAVIGADGQLGTDLSQAFEQNGDDVHGLGHAEVEITSPESVEDALSKIGPDLVVNTAAFHQVEQCESQTAKAFAVNACGVRNLAVAVARLGAVIIHLSTDYVFDGSKGTPYLETDLPRPLNAYGTTKLAGEHFVSSASPRHFVVRTSALYGKHPCRAKGGLNFVELMRKLAKDDKEIKVVNNEFVTPTATLELAKQIVQLSRSDAFGLYHATAEGSCSWYEFAREIFELTGTGARLKVAGATDSPPKVRRPKYSVLENAALKSLGMNVFRNWRDGLKDYLTAPVSAGKAAGLESALPVS
jgi:dTDP-4-dehydrorhamnose reductase